MDMSVHSWQICVQKICISKGISYIRQIQRTYTKVLHEIYSNVTKVFQITFYLLFTNMSCLDTPSTPNNLHVFDCDFYWWPRAKQTTHMNMVWYLNMNKSTYSHWSKHVGETLASAMHFIFFAISMFFFAEIAHLCSLITDTLLFGI